MYIIYAESTDIVHALRIICLQTDEGQLEFYP